MNDDSSDEILSKVMAIFSKKKSIFNFGTCSERRTFAEKTVPSRLGILYPIRNDHPNLGPGTYDMEYDTIAYNLRNKLCNAKGWSASQRDGRGTNDVPGPTDYQSDISAPRSFKQNRYPFNQKCPRSLPEDPRGTDAPSVGTYNWFVKHKKFDWQRDTNLKPVNLPQITFKSTVCANTAKLPYFQEEKKYQRRLRFFENYFKEDEK